MKSKTKPLSAREHETLQLIANGLSASNIAKRMKVSIKTTTTFRGRAMAKLSLPKGSTDVALLREALVHGLVKFPLVN